jgi:hypothetical protein
MTADQTDDLLHHLRTLLNRTLEVGARFSAYGQQERADECARFAEIVRCWIANIEAERP